MDPSNPTAIGNTIKVHAGHYIDLSSHRPVDIDVRSIAASLSKMCRFGCQCPRFYSVAEHCVHAARLAIADGSSPEESRAILFHDAAEAYIGDVVKPLKIMLPDYAEVEKKMERAVGEALGIDFDKHHDIIKHYDLIVFKSEKKALWPGDGEEWSGLASIEDREINFKFYSPSQGERKFLVMNTFVDFAAELQLPTVVI